MIPNALRAGLAAALLAATGPALAGPVTAGPVTAGHLTAGGPAGAARLGSLDRLLRGLEWPGPPGGAAAIGRAALAADLDRLGRTLDTATGPLAGRNRAGLRALEFRLDALERAARATGSDAVRPDRPASRRRVIDTAIPVTALRLEDIGPPPGR